MPRIDVELFLEAEVVQTEAAVTLGVHSSLDFIRGSSLLGVAAAKLYQGFGHDAYTVFHSGRVRFLDAHPAGAGGTMYPAPMGWLHAKDQAFVHGDRLQADRLYSVSHLEPGEAAKHALEQVRRGYFSPFGEWVEPELNFRLKTAISRKDRGRPERESLFGYEALAAGTRWRAAIEMDDDIDASIHDRLAGIFDDTVIWIGRSRGAEYGRVRASVVGCVPDEDPSGTAARVSVCLTSDLALADEETGEPTLSPRPTHFGLPPDWRLEPERSAVMTRRYSPFNNKRRRRDLEHVVIGRRSVLTFSGTSPVDIAEVRRFSDRGVGGFRQEGLGQVRIAPWFLAERHPVFRERPGTVGDIPSVEEAGKGPPGPLGPWIERRVREAENDVIVLPVARDAALALARLVRKQGKLHRATPSRSQWQQVAGLVKGHLMRRESTVETVARELTARMFERGVAANIWRLEVSAGTTLASVFLDLGTGGKAENQPVFGADDRRKITCLHQTAVLTARYISKHREGGEA